MRRRPPFVELEGSALDIKEGVDAKQSVCYGAQIRARRGYRTNEGPKNKVRSALFPVMFIYVYCWHKEAASHHAQCLEDHLI